MLIQDHHIRVIHAATGEFLHELVLDPTKDYQPTGRPPGPTPKTSSPDPQSPVRAIPMSCDITGRARQDSNLQPLDP